MPWAPLDSRNPFLKLTAYPWAWSLCLYDWFLNAGTACVPMVRGEEPVRAGLVPAMDGVVRPVNAFSQYLNRDYREPSWLPIDVKWPKAMSFRKLSCSWAFGASWWVVVG
eukprot:12430311-Karenia_brevis.AAC.1